MKQYPETKEWIIPEPHGRGYGHFWLADDGWITSEDVEVEGVRWESLELSEFIAKVTTAGAAFIGEPTVTIDAHEEWDQTIPTISLSGLRRATPEESQRVEQWIAEAPAREREAAHRSIREAEARLLQVRAQYPDVEPA